MNRQLVSGEKILFTDDLTHKTRTRESKYLCDVIHDGYLKLHVHEGFVWVGDLIIQNVLKKTTHTWRILHINVVVAGVSA